MSKSSIAEKNKRIAAEMKRLGIERTTGRCPNCYKIVQNGTKHFINCVGTKPRG